MGNNTNYADWLKGLAEKWGKGVVHNIDARALGRAGAALERAEADGAAMRGALEKIGACDIAGYCISGADTSGKAIRLVEKFYREMNWRIETARQALSTDPGDKLMADLREKVLAACHLPEDAPEGGWPQDAVDAVASVKEQICAALDGGTG